MTRCVRDTVDGGSLVDALLDGEITSSQRAQLEAHLAECEACAQTLRTIRAASDAWRDAEDAPLSIAARDRMGDRIFEAIQEGARSVRNAPPGPPTVRRGVLAAVAAFAAVILLALVAWRVDSRDVAPASVAPLAEPRGAEPGSEASRGRIPKPGAPITVAEGASIRLAISDFATLLLDDGAVAEVVEREEGYRLELKRGTATARVDHDKLDGVFAVETPAGIVEVTGTVFSVHVAGTSQLSVAVLEGGVTVRDAVDSREAIRIGAGQQISVDWTSPRAERLDDAWAARIREEMDLVEGKGAAQASSRRSGQAAPKERAPAEADFEPLFEEATRARAAGSPSTASRIYERIMAQAAEPSVRAEAAFTQGQLLFASGDMAGAARVLSSHEGLLRKTPYHLMSLVYLAKADCALGDFRGARESIDEFLETAPQHAMASSLRELRARCVE